MLNALWIFMGGGLGSLARWGLAVFVALLWAETFPLGPLVKVTGSLVTSKKGN
jgi:fluoride ion exporter CrcB/FEX